MISPSYVKQIFVAHCAGAREESNGNMLGSCPICGEGKSGNRKRRLYYYPETGSLFCFNCQRSWIDVKWCAEVEGRTEEEVRKDAREFGGTFFYIPKVESTHNTKEEEVDELPLNAINLSSPTQLSYYGSDKYINLALQTIKNRRLDTCVNRLEYYISLDDPVHRNRLVIPFKDQSGKIVYYQTRRLVDDGSPKYLCKKGSKPTVFGIDKLDTSSDYYFLFEGPIDSCFVKNGLAVCGLRMTAAQESQLDGLFCQQRIWVLDNDFRTNKDVARAYHGLLNKGERVFIWPKALNAFKDVNELCISRKMDSIKEKVFIDNSFEGDEGCKKLQEAIEGKF